MKVNEEKNLDVPRDETRDELNACGGGGHVFLSGASCRCGQMVRESKYCASCRVEHVHYRS